MRKTARMIVLAMLCAASYSACQRASEEKREENRLVNADSLNQSFVSINDSLDARWKVLIAEEDQKLEDMKRLLKEISFTPRYNKTKLQELQEKLETVYEMRFQPQSMTSEQIDRYDSASSALKQEIISFAQNHPDIEQYPLMGQLIDSIEASDQRVLFHRVRYDNFARDYNHFLEGNREYVRKVDTTGLHNKRTLFQLGE